MSKGLRYYDKNYKHISKLSGYIPVSVLCELDKILEYYSSIYTNLRFTLKRNGEDIFLIIALLQDNDIKVKVPVEFTKITEIRNMHLIINKKLDGDSMAYYLYVMELLKSKKELEEELGKINYLIESSRMVINSL